MKHFNNDKGFTLIEILLVVVMIGIMMAVIIPRGQRANTDSKYSIVRQNCSELASYANDWVEQQLLAQDSDSNSTRGDYFLTLAAGTGSGGATLTSPARTQTGGSGYIAQQTTSNWNNTGFGASAIVVNGRRIGGLPAAGGAVAGLAPEAPVESIIDPAKIPVNPFNSISVFGLPNDSPNATINTPVAGSIACFAANDSSSGASQTYYALVFQGIESTTIVDGAATAFHSGMAGSTLAGLRNGTFLTRTIP